MQRLGDLMRDPSRCTLVLVTIPEAMSVLETVRTLELLQSQGMPVTAIAVNMVQPPRPECSFCSDRRASQLLQLGQVVDLVGEVPVILVEHELSEPRGEQKIAELAQKVWVGQDQVLRGPGPVRS